MQPIVGSDFYKSLDASREEGGKKKKRDGICSRYDNESTAAKRTDENLVLVSSSLLSIIVSLRSK